LGLRLVKRLSAGGIAQLLASRKLDGPFQNVPSLIERTGITRGDLHALIDAGALARIAGHRHRAQWEALGTERLTGLLAGASSSEPGTLELPLPCEGEDLIADYRSLGLTLGRHPLSLLRATLNEQRYDEASAARASADGELIRIVLAQ